jgi:hypothetical protein
MKRFIFTGLSILLLSAVTAPGAKAGTRIENQLHPSLSTTVPSTQTPATASPAPRINLQLSMRPAVSHKTTTLSPTDLVFLAYQGYFQNNGIPSSGRLLSAYNESSVQAKDLVQAGIQSQRLSEETAGDVGYVNAVANALQFLKID